MTYVKSHLNVSENSEVTLKLLDNIRPCEGDERIMELTSDIKIQFAVFMDIRDGFVNFDHYNIFYVYLFIKNYLTDERSNSKNRFICN